MLIISAHFIDRLTAASSTIAHYLKSGIMACFWPIRHLRAFYHELAARAGCRSDPADLHTCIRSPDSQAGNPGGPRAGMRAFQIPTGSAHRSLSAAAAQVVRARRLSISGAIMALISVALCGRPVLGDIRASSLSPPYHNLLGIGSLLYMPEHSWSLILTLGYVSFTHRHHGCDSRYFVAVALLGGQVLELIINPNARWV